MYIIVYYCIMNYMHREFLQWFINTVPNTKLHLPLSAFNVQVREVSNRIMQTASVESDPLYIHLVTIFGQWTDHDLTFTLDSLSSAHSVTVLTVIRPVNVQSNVSLLRSVRIDMSTGEKTHRNENDQTS